MNDHGQILDPGTVRLERVLPGPIERVWRYLTDSDKRARWLAAGQFELRPGGRAEFRFDHASLSSEKTYPERHKGAEGAQGFEKVLECDPPRLLRMTWGGPDEPAEVCFELTPEGDRVRLVLTTRRLPTRDEVVGTASGWHAHLAILADTLAERPPRGFWSTLADAERDYQQRMQVMDDHFRWAAGNEREIHDHGGTWSSLLRRRLDAPIDRVWAAWTDPDALRNWFGRPSGSFEVGGTVVLELSQPHPTTVKILACEPPTRLRTTWRYGDFADSEVELRLTRDGAGTSLELQHFACPDADDARGGGGGWEAALLQLESFLGGLPPPAEFVFPAMDHAWSRVTA
ncbi:SRPBCC family protein [Nannocystis bainbridge]|uniref:SRPBCC family protein n=1 Tax=Nannocystis bainbridge TaxID=2995303 RepID=A0ABT5E6Q2_9BACT|nr:SRPBCC family protein [Nannocystis bainbridge]MDC0721541.1 SRPBCC family protein [Nannocystis bainbridge]